MCDAYDVTAHDHKNSQKNECAAYVCMCVYMYVYYRNVP